MIISEQMRAYEADFRVPLAFLKCGMINNRRSLCQRMHYAFLNYVVISMSMQLYAKEDKN